MRKKEKKVTYRQSVNFKLLSEVSDVASSAYLPHTGDSRFNSDSSPVM